MKQAKIHIASTAMLMNDESKESPGYRMQGLCGQPLALQGDFISVQAYTTLDYYQGFSRSHDHCICKNCLRAYRKLAK